MRGGSVSKSVAYPGAGFGLKTARVQHLKTHVRDTLVGPVIADVAAASETTPFSTSCPGPRPATNRGRKRPCRRGEKPPDFTPGHCSIPGPGSTCGRRAARDGRGRVFASIASRTPGHGWAEGDLARPSKRVSERSPRKFQFTNDLRH